MATEVHSLFEVVGWSSESVRTIKQSLAAYPCKVCARSVGNMQLVGYASVFSDGVMTTMLGELIVHPEHRRKGVATGIMNLVESLYPDAPISVKALGESKLFYESIGFKEPKASMTVMFKRPAQSGRLPEPPASAGGA